MRGMCVRVCVCVCATGYTSLSAWIVLKLSYACCFLSLRLFCSRSLMRILSLAFFKPPPLLFSVAPVVTASGSLMRLQIY